MEQMIEIVKEMRAAASATPILVHANAGLPKTVNGVDVFPESPEEMARASQSDRRGRRQHHRRLLRHHPGAYQGDPESSGRTAVVSYMVASLQGYIGLTVPATYVTQVTHLTM